MARQKRASWWMTFAVTAILVAVLGLALLASKQYGLHDFWYGGG